MKKLLIILLLVILMTGHSQPQEPDTFKDSIYWRGM